MISERDPDVPVTVIVEFDDLAHGFLTIEHDGDDANGLYIQAAAHGATGYAFLPRDDIERLRDALTRWLGSESCT